MKIMAGRAEELNKIAASVTANVPDMVGLKGLTAVCQEFTTTLNSLVQGKPFSFEKPLITPVADIFTVKIGQQWERTIFDHLGGTVDLDQKSPNLRTQNLNAMYSDIGVSHGKDCTIAKNVQSNDTLNFGYDSWAEGVD